jgi:hypothetical protein
VKGQETQLGILEKSSETYYTATIQAGPYKGRRVTVTQYESSQSWELVRVSLSHTKVQPYLVLYDMSDYELV